MNGKVRQKGTGLTENDSDEDTDRGGYSNDRLYRHVRVYGGVSQGVGRLGRTDHRVHHPINLFDDSLRSVWGAGLIFIRTVKLQQ